MPFGKFTLSAPKPTDLPKILSTLGDHLKKRRLELDLYKKEVALRLKVNEWTYLLWENDQATPSIRMMPRIIAFLDYDPFPAPYSLGERLTAKRRQLGLSRKRLATMLRVDEATLAHWERGTRSPRGKRLGYLAKFLAASS